MSSRPEFQYLANIRMPTEKAHGVQIMKTCEALARAGAQVELLVSARHSDIVADPFTYYAIEPAFAIKRVPVLDLVWLGRIGFWLESVSFAFFAMFYTLHSPGVIYSRDELPLFLLSFFRKNVVWESHTGRYNFLVRRMLRASSKIVVISEGLKQFYERKGFRAKMLVAPDGIDLATFAHPEPKEEARKRLGLPLDKKIALYIGRLDGWKGVNVLLDATAILPSDILVAIIGGEEEQVKKLRVEYPHVLFLGYHPYRELADNQVAADILILPNTSKDVVSAQFTSPMKLFSYMAAGRPVVASDLPSLREVLHEGSAVFFEPDNARSLAQAIAEILSNPARAEQVASRARTDVARYTWDARALSILSFTQA